MKSIIYLLLLVLLYNPLIKANDTVTKPRERVIMGWLEPLMLLPSGVTLKAKLDSGAKTSSIHAKNINRFKKDGEDWVSFDIPVQEDKKDLIALHIERPLVRDVVIKRHLTNAHERPVVTLPFCMNGEDHEAQFNLIDRSRFNYPVLLGRLFIKKVALIDPGAVYINNRMSECRTRHPQPAKQKSLPADAAITK